MNDVKNDILNLKDYQDIIKSVNKINKKIMTDDMFFSLFEELLLQDKETVFILMTFLVKKRELYKKEYFSTYERWLYSYVDSWSNCDAYCYRVLNPMLERYNNIYTNVLVWAKSDKVYVRRASLVIFIQSKKHFEVHFDITKILNICDILKFDKHIHIEKALGWVLKYAYLTYSNEIENYLRDNVKILSRTSYRYALEKMPTEKRNELLKL